MNAPSLICSTCQSPCAMTTNGECISCAEVSQKRRQAKMAIRQDPAQFDTGKLVNCLLREHWMHECKIVPAYMPPYPDSTTRPRCVVAYVREDGKETFLRYSKGPAQGFFWDVYGDDLHSPELALVAISAAPSPTSIATHCR